MATDNYILIFTFRMVFTILSTPQIQINWVRKHNYFLHMQGPKKIVKTSCYNYNHKNLSNFIKLPIRDVHCPMAPLLCKKGIFFTIHTIYVKNIINY